MQLYLYLYILLWKKRRFFNNLIADKSIIFLVYIFAVIYGIVFGMLLDVIIERDQESSQVIYNGLYIAMVILPLIRKIFPNFSESISLIKYDCP